MVFFRSVDQETMQILLVMNSSRDFVLERLLSFEKVNDFFFDFFSELKDFLDSMPCLSDFFDGCSFCQVTHMGACSLLDPQDLLDRTFA